MSCSISKYRAKNVHSSRPDLIFENNCGIARSIVSDNLFARERLGSTGLGHGVAVPHGRIKGLKAPLAAFVRLNEPIPFESPDGQPVKLLIFLLIPDHVTQQHLEILSEIAEMFSDEAFRTALLTDPDPASVHARIIAWQPSVPGRLTDHRPDHFHAAHSTHLTIQQLYDDNARSAATGLVRRLSRWRTPHFGDATSAADQVGHLNLIHPGRSRYSAIRKSSTTSSLSPASRKSPDRRTGRGRPAGVHHRAGSGNAGLTSCHLRRAKIFRCSPRRCRPRR